MKLEKNWVNLKKGYNSFWYGKNLPDVVKEKMRIAALNRTKSNKPGTLVEITNITTNITTQFLQLEKQLKEYIVIILLCKGIKLNTYQISI